MSSSGNLENFRIPLEELKRTTNNFDSSSITKGGYRGDLSERWQNRTAFIKRYNKEEYESHELEIVSRLHHEDITSFIGYCDEDDKYIYMATFEYMDGNALMKTIENMNKHKIPLKEIRKAIGAEDFDRRIISATKPHSC